MLTRFQECEKAACVCGSTSDGKDCVDLFTLLVRFGLEQVKEKKEAKTIQKARGKTWVKLGA